MRPDNIEALLERNRELQARLDIAEETLRAIRNGEVDAVVAAGPDGDAVYTLKGADEGYRLLVEQMAEGALTLTTDGLILFANDQLARMLGLPLDRVIGHPIYDFVASESRGAMEALLSSGDGAKFEMELMRVAGVPLPVYLAPGRLQSDGIACITLVVTDLSDQKRNEEIVTAGRLASSILEQAAAAILVLDPDGRVIQANQVAETLATGPVLLRPFNDAFRLGFHPQSKELTFEEISSTVRTQGAIRGLQAIAHVRSDNPVPVLVSAGILTSADFESLGYVITLYDISDLKQAEEALRASETKYRRLFESMQEAFFVAEVVTDESGSPVDYRFLEANPALEHITGLRRCDLVGRLVTEAMPGVDQHWIEVFGRVALTGEPTHFEQYSTPLKRWYEAFAYSPQPGQFATAFSDITERRRAEEALRESEARLRTVSDNLPEAALYRYTLSTEGKPRFDFMSAGIERLTGVQASEAMNDATVVDKATLPEDSGRMTEAIRLSAERLAPFEFEIRFVHQKTREIRWSLLRSMPTRNPDGSTSWDGIQLDITERKRLEEQLRESEARERARGAEFEAFLEATPVAMFISQDPECRTMIGNRMTYELLRLNPGANVSKSALEAEAPATFRAMLNGREIPPEDLPAQKAALTGKPVRNYEFDVVYQDGTCRNMLGEAVPLFGEDGKPRGAVGAFVDITERKRTEERLRQTQKLESIGLLAGGIAHDFNNILTGVMGNASLLLEDAAPERAEVLRSIITGTERAAHLTRQLLAYSGKGQFIVRDLDLTQAVYEMADLVQFSIPKSADLRLDLGRRLPPVAMDPGQLQQILMNLVINAGEAIGEGNSGRITVRTSMSDINAPFIDDLGEEVPPGRYVSIEVRDTGSGIAPEAKARVFDPFFTTKFVGRGLGLAAVAGIMRSQKGGITVESAPGQGTTFRVFLPVARSGALAVHEPTTGAGHASVLVVDDEGSVRDFIASVLRRKGYHVIQASDGEEALAISGSAPGAISAAIVDIIMPKMGANELLPALKAKQPGMRILLTSGYSEAEARRLCAAYPGAAFIQKPYTAQQLAKAVSELIMEPV